MVEGGLGIGIILQKNITLFFKSISRYSNGKDELWKRMVNSIYDINSHIATPQVLQKCNTSVWGTIKTASQDFQEYANLLWEGMHVRVGGGVKVSFYIKNCAHNKF